jgi:O-antigen ligase
VAAVIVLNGLLITRPEELYPSLGGLRLYMQAILLCLVVYAPGVFRELSGPRLVRNPFLVLILVLLVAVVMSHLSRMRFDRAVAEGGEFVKLVVYYVVLIAAITTRSRLRTFLTALLVFIAIQTTLGMAQFYGYIDNPGLEQVQQREIDENWVVVATYQRLCGSGIYNDPNILSLLLTIGMLVCLSRFVAGRGLMRVVWLIPFGYFGFALTLTKSRGGLMTATAGLLTFVVGRYGGKKGLLLCLVLVPLALVAFGGRQTKVDLSSREDTSQGRIILWNEGLQHFPSNPLFGIGAGEYLDRVGQVAHNSYVQAFVELGLLGGVSFVAAFVLAVRVVAITRPAPTLSPEAAADLERLRLVVLGVLVSYMTGMFSLSCNYIPPTYLILALATVYARLASPGGVRWFVMDGRMVHRVVVVGLAALVFLLAFVKLLVSYH